MKMLLVCLFISNIVGASDLIYLNGFENKAMVSGTVMGLSSDGLMFKLSATDGQETLAINNNGHFVFWLPITVGNQWQVALTGVPNHPSQQSCILSNNSGVMTPSGVNNLLIECTNQQWNWNQMNWGESGWQ